MPEEADAAGPIQVTSGGKTSNGFLFSPRFHPDALLRFDSLRANTQATLHLQFQQLHNADHLEAPLAASPGLSTPAPSISPECRCTAWSATSTSSPRIPPSPATRKIRYSGIEEETGRHVFHSRFVTFHVAEAAAGSGGTISVTLSTEGLLRSLVWDCHFTTPLYHPPGGGTSVETRMEIQSRQWRSALFPPMTVVKNYRQRVVP